jgi:hypothetical protein
MFADFASKLGLSAPPYFYWIIIWSAARPMLA